MSSAQVMNKKKAGPGAEPVDMKLEAVLLDVSDVDRAKAFYEKLGWRLDLDLAIGDFRGVQLTPHNSRASIIFGKILLISPRRLPGINAIILRLSNLYCA